MTEPPPEPTHRAHLVQQDIRIAREAPEDPASRVRACVQCARNGCAMDVEDCARCPHFARIETHEAGYLLLCRMDEETASSTKRCDHEACESCDRSQR